MNNVFDFDFKSLEIFVNTVDCGNMTTAAERLGTTQPTISQNLAYLEQSLKVKLLDRSVRPLKVTTAGRFFYDSAKNILQLAHKTNIDMRQSNYHHLHHVNIAIVDSLVTSLGAALVEALKSHASTWTINTGLSHSHAEGLLSRNVDMILSDDSLEEHPELMRYRLLREPFVLVMPKGYQGNVSEISSILKDLDFIRYSTNSLIGLTVERYLNRMGVNPPESLKLDNTFAILSSVSAGLGWTITTPLCLFQHGVQQDKIDCYQLPGEPLYRNLTLVYRSNQLWKLPSIIAKNSCNILQRDFMTYIHDHLCWLEDQIKVG